MTWFACRPEFAHFKIKENEKGTDFFEGTNETVNLSQMAAIGKSDMDNIHPIFYSISFYTTGARIIEWIFASKAHRDQVFNEVMEHATKTRLLTEYI